MNPTPTSNREGQSTPFSDNNITLFIFILAFITIWNYLFIYFYYLSLYLRSVCKLSGHRNFMYLLTDIFLAPKQCLAYSCHFEKGNRMNKCVPHVESFLLLCNFCLQFLEINYIIGGQYIKYFHSRYKLNWECQSMEEDYHLLELNIDLMFLK